MNKRNMTLAALAAAALALTTGCAGGVGGGSQGGDGGGEGVPAGATKEQYQAAFEDIDPITLKVQDIAPSADSPAGRATAAWMADVEEWSGGKITADITWSNSIAAVDEVPDALNDGRLDIAQWSTTFFDRDIPAYKALRDSLISIPSSPLHGELLTHLVAQDMAFNTPEIQDEFDDQGVVPLNPHDHYASSSLACADEKLTTAAFRGAQVRINADTLDPQVGSLGMTSLAVDTGEVYEALERGQVDCVVGAMSSLNGYGWIDAAPHVYFPEGSSFVPGPGGKFAGSSWETFPLVVRQLIFDRLVTYDATVFAEAFTQQIEGVERANAAGGTVQYLDADSSTRVKEARDEILAEIQDSTVLDGGRFTDELNAATQKWDARLEELGFTDQGTFEEFSDWFEGSVDASSLDYTMPAAEALYQEVLSAHRPE